jgi:hypothetical protein
VFFPCLKFDHFDAAKVAECRPQKLTIPLKLISKNFLFKQMISNLRSLYFSFPNNIFCVCEVFFLGERIDVICALINYYLLGLLY